MIRVTRSMRGLLIHTIGLLVLHCAAMGAVGRATIAIDPTFGPAPGIQDNVSIAAGANGYLAVWQDTRGTNGLDIFGCRISATGQVLDLMSIPICTLPGDQLTPAVTWDGSQYVVVWADRWDPIQHIYGCRVSAAVKCWIPRADPCPARRARRVPPEQQAAAAAPWLYGRTNVVVTRHIWMHGLQQRDGRQILRNQHPGDNEETPDVAYNGSLYLVAGATTGTWSPPTPTSTECASRSWASGRGWRC